MKCVITGKTAILQGPFPIEFIGVIASLSGKKKWMNSTEIEFESIPHNINKLRGTSYKIEFQDDTGLLADMAEFENMPTQIAQVDAAQTDYRPKLPLRDYQQKAVNLSAERKSYAYLMEMGLGKSAVCITNIGMLALANKLTGVLILAPKGVHRQWLDEQFPEHFDSRIRYMSLIWNGTVLDVKRKDDRLVVLSMNIDAIRTKKGFETAVNFLRANSGSSMMVIDESHNIKSGTAQRTKSAWKLGELATYRRILTGTPISRNVADMWAQFKFLDERILGHRYFISFRNHFCLMGGFEGRQIIGQKNIEELYQLIAPHSYRLTKKEALDLPEKIYIKRRYEMSEICAAHYQSLKNSFITQLDNGEIVDANNAITCLLRLQQVLCGFLPNEEGEAVTEFSNDRIQQMLEIIEQTEGQAVIWCRFTHDILRITKLLNENYGKGSAVCYYGGNVKERDESVEKFLNMGARFFVSNPSAGGTGLNLQKSGCQTVIYYSNNFNYITRAQSEDRTHRIGMKGAVTYFDIVADKSIDGHILRNLRAKKSISELTLDEIRASLV